LANEIVWPGGGIRKFIVYRRLRIIRSLGG